jgi:ribosome recycling factor
MRVQVEVLCTPKPSKAIVSALEEAGRRLTPRMDSVSVRVYEGESLTAILEFEMRREALYKVIDRIWEQVKFWTQDFREDITVRFPKDQA